MANEPLENLRDALLDIHFTLKEILAELKQAGERHFEVKSILKDIRDRKARP